MRTIARLSTFAALGVAALTLPSLAWANGCSSSYASDNVCSLGENGGGLQSSTITPGTQAPALAITGVLSGAVSGRAAPGTQRAAFELKGETGAAAAAAAPKWNAWFSLAQSNVGYDFQPARSSGRVNVVLGGVDYTFNNNVILGVAYSDDQTRIDTQFNNGSLNGSGYMIAPYLAVPFGRNWVFDASIGMGRNKLSQVDNAAGNVTGNAMDNRFFSSAAVSYAAQIGKMQWTGKGMYLFSEDKIDQFTQSNNVVVPSSTTRVAQIRLGGQLAYDAGGMMPYAGLTYIRDTQAPTQRVIAGQTAANDRDAWQVAVGINFYNRGPLSGGVQYTQDTNRAQVKNNMLMGNISYKF